jgi:putative transposase
MGMAVDVSRSQRDLIIESAVLRHQINILRRGKKRPRLGVTDRLKLLLGALLLPAWCRAIAIMQPDTLLRWHRAGFRLFWRLRSRPRRGSPLAKETIDLIRDMARRGRLWGAERIQ